jgi:hypothetical protein
MVAVSRKSKHEGDLTPKHRAIIPGTGGMRAVNPIPSLCLNLSLADQAELDGVLNPRTRLGGSGQVDDITDGSKTHFGQVTPYIDDGKVGYWLQPGTTHPPTTDRVGLAGMVVNS